MNNNYYDSLYISDDENEELKLSFIEKKQKIKIIDDLKENEEKEEAITDETKPEVEEVKIIQNSDYLYKSDIKWAEPQSISETIEPNAYEVKMLEGTSSVKEFLKKEKEEIQEEETEKERRHNHISKVKIIGLSMMDKDILSNPTYFSRKEREILIKNMEEVLKLDVVEITKKFNEIVLEQLFESNRDYSKFPVYKVK